jgi:predicted enzyme related to lactoylglutathione lyase
LAVYGTTPPTNRKQHGASAIMEGRELERLLERPDLTAAFERWRVVLPPGSERPTSAEEWSGAVVLVQAGALEVECLAGGRRTFAAGDLLVLGWLPLRSLRNVGLTEVRLLCVRRAGDRPRDAFLEVVRHQRRRPPMTYPSRPGLQGRSTISLQHASAVEAVMFGQTKAFSSFSVDDLAAARQFYGQTLGLKVDEVEGMGLLTIDIAGQRDIVVYGKDNHQPASFTILNFPVDDIDGAVDQLLARGVKFERYDGFEQDDRGISRGEAGPPIAWFTDPAGNILAVLEQPV